MMSIPISTTSRSARRWTGFWRACLGVWESKGVSVNPFSDVTLYGQPNCVGCDSAIWALEDANLSVDKVNILENEAAMTYVTGVLGVKSVPVIVSDVADPIVGYRPDEIEELIDLIRAKKLATEVHDYVYEEGEG